MGEAKRREQARADWPDSHLHSSLIDLHVLATVATTDGVGIRELTGDDSIPEASEVIVRAFMAGVGERTFHVGPCLGHGKSFIAVGIAAIERRSMEARGAAVAQLHWAGLVVRLFEFRHL